MYVFPIHITLRDSCVAVYGAKGLLSWVRAYCVGDVWLCADSRAHMGHHW